MNLASFTEPQTTATAISRADELHPTASVDVRTVLRVMLEVAGSSNGAIWRRHGQQLQPVIRTDEEGADEKSQHRLFDQVIESNTPILESGDETRFTLLIPFTRGDSRYTVSIKKDSNRVDAEMCLALCALVAERLQVAFARHNERTSLRAFRRAATAYEIVSEVGQGIDLDATAFVAASRLQQYFGADRVSVAVRWPGGCRVHAISHQPTFDRRADVVKAITALASHTCRQQIIVQYPDAQSHGPELKARLSEICEAAHAKTVITLPVFAERAVQEHDPTVAQPKCIGAIVIEGIASPLNADRILRRWSRVETGVSSAIANARQYRLLRFLPTRTALAPLYSIGRFRKTAFALLTVLVASMFVIRGDFRVRTEGVIQPGVMRHLYAAQQGTIKRLLVNDGETVTAGQLLASLENPDLSARIARIEGDIDETKTQLGNAMMRRIARQFSSPNEERDLVRTTATLETRLNGLNEELAILHRSNEELRVESPVDGKVITWDVERRLRGRPVQPGQRLLTIADLDSGWEIELNVRDRHAGHVLRMHTRNLERGRPTTIRFVLMSDVTRKLEARVIDVSPSAHVDNAEHDNVLRVTAKVAEADLIGPPKPGTTVLAHIDCGHASLAYCKTYEFVDWLRRICFQMIG